MDERPSATGGQPVPRWYVAAIPALLAALGVVVALAAVTT